MATHEAMPVRRVLLVGFMASGKTAVGKLLAHSLRWPFVDFDAVIEERTGCTIPEIFRDLGEEAFRRLEAEVGEELLARERVVLASGGGWAATPGRLDDLDPATLSVWLRVSPETAVRRARAARQTRPLLEVRDPVRTARNLLEQREPHYRRARLVVDSEDASPDELARVILRAVRLRARPAGDAR
ncbi:MAG: shikimate kinase [Gemmatimonadetes bacterium]|nr:shikimate kinase [Gemmatimonadota bacterium]